MQIYAQCDTSVSHMARQHESTQIHYFGVRHWAELERRHDQHEVKHTSCLFSAFFNGQIKRVNTHSNVQYMHTHTHSTVCLSFHGLWMQIGWVSTFHVAPGRVVKLGNIFNKLRKKIATWRAVSKSTADKTTTDKTTDRFMSSRIALHQHF